MNAFSCFSAAAGSREASAVLFSRILAWGVRSAVMKSTSTVCASPPPTAYRKTRRPRREEDHLRPALFSRVRPAEVSKPARTFAADPAAASADWTATMGTSSQRRVCDARREAPSLQWSASLVTSVLTPSVTPVVTGTAWNAPSNIQTVPRVPAPLPDATAGTGPVLREHLWILIERRQHGSRSA